SDEGVGRGDDLVARLHPRREQGQMQGARARVHGDAVLDAAVGRELLLEVRDLLAEDERGRSADAVERGEDVLAEARVLRLQVEVRDLHGSPGLPDLVDEDRIPDHGDGLATGGPGGRVTRPAEP